MRAKPIEFGRYPGPLCRKKHDYENTGRSLRAKTGHCLQCNRDGLARRRQNNPEHFREKAKRLYWENPAKVRTQQLRGYFRRHSQELERARIYRESNREALRERQKAAKRRFRTRPESRQYANAYYLINNVRVRIRNRVFKALQAYSQNGKTQTVADYGIDIAAIAHHLGPCPGHRSEWHIDHIRPLSSFHLDDPEQIKIAFAPENHQWLRAEENRSKYTKPYGQYLAESGRFL